jgi:hypothetical protein
MKALYTTPALLLAGVLAVGAIGASSQSGTGAAVGVAAACTWLDPQPERIAITMEHLTDEPVDNTHWNEWVDRTDGLTTSDYTASTRDDRHLLLVTAITGLLNVDLEPDITTPVVTWWAGAMPTDDTDIRWRTVTVAGWDGNLETYIGAYANAYATNPDVLVDVEAAGLPTACANPAPATTCPQPYDSASALAATRLIESGGNYTDNRELMVTADDDPPTGAYHYTRAEWAGYGGYNDAWQAPADVQDAHALDDITAIVTALGDKAAWIPVAWTAGIDIARQIHDGQLSTGYIPHAGGTPVAAYRTRWLQLYVEALTRNDITLNDCPAGASAVIAWADTQIGAPYASVTPWRFGVPWPGGNKCITRGTPPATTCWDYPAGTIAYDCSGFVITAWRHGGIDFGQLGLHSSQQFLTNLIPDADRNALQPGDLAVYRPINGIGHIVLIHHIDPNGTVRTIEASGSAGVHIGTLDWERVTALKHPAVTPPGPDPHPVVDDGTITWKPGEPHTVTIGDGTSRPYTGWASNIPVDHYDRNGHPVPVLVHPAGHPEIQLAPVAAQRMRAWEAAYGAKFIFSGSPAAYRPFPATGISYSRYTKQWRLVHYIGHFSGESIDLHLTAMGIDPYKPLSDPRRQRWEALKRAAAATGWECWNPTDEPWHWSVNGRH